MKVLTGVRGRVLLTVLAVAACLYSMLGTIGFLQIAHSGHDAVVERVNTVLDQLEVTLRAGTGTVRIATADGVQARLAVPGASPAEVNEITVQRPIVVGGRTVTIVGTASEARLTDSLRSLHRGLWIAVPLASLLTAAVAGLAIGRALRPVSEITDLAATIGRADTLTRVPVPDTDDEIHHLARTINEMLDRIADGRLAQQRFTSDAAHELRTPLMALQGEVELAMRHGVGDDPGLLPRIEALSRRLQTRVDDLVLLSTLDEQPPLDRQLVDLLELVTEEVDSLGSSSVTTEVVGEPAVAMVDRRLMEHAVRNLVANARRHASTRVRVSVTAAGDRALITLDDDGVGVASADRAQIFQRFGRLDEARTHDAGGAGLGLAIVASVARVHGGEVTVGDSELGGASFRLAVPLN